jgi:hypothetical protein
MYAGVRFRESRRAGQDERVNEDANAAMNVSEAALGRRKRTADNADGRRAESVRDIDRCRWSHAHVQTSRWTSFRRDVGTPAPGTWSAGTHSGRALVPPAYRSSPAAAGQHIRRR